MDIKNILVVVSSVGEGGPLKTAIALAKRHGADLAALHVKPTPVVYGGVGGEIPVVIIEAQERETEAAAEAIKAEVETVARRAGVGIEWRCEPGDEVNVAAIHARYADLTVAKPDVARDLVFASASPVLAVPVATSAGAPTRALIAWNGSREAARAVRDALPLLKAADSVDIIAVDPPEGTGGMDLARSLGRHGIKVEVRERLSGGAEVGGLLLEEVRTSGADLLVMGAYGHSRVREWVLGGATEDVLELGTVPALLSH